MGDGRAPAASLACAMAVPFAVAFMGSLATRPALQRNGYYRRIRKPWWTPRDGAFPAVWTLLYAFMGVASWRIWMASGLRQPQVSAYVATLVLNMLFSPLLFALHKPWVAFVDSMLLLVATVACVGAYL